MLLPTYKIVTVIPGVTGANHIMQIEGAAYSFEVVSLKFSLDAPDDGDWLGIECAIGDSPHTTGGTPFTNVGRTSLGLPDPTGRTSILIPADPAVNLTGGDLGTVNFADNIVEGDIKPADAGIEFTILPEERMLVQKGDALLIYGTKALTTAKPLHVSIGIAG